MLTNSALSTPSSSDLKVLVFSGVRVHVCERGCVRVCARMLLTYVCARVLLMYACARVCYLHMCARVLLLYVCAGVLVLSTAGLIEFFFSFFLLFCKKVT